MIRRRWILLKHTSTIGKIGSEQNEGNYTQYDLMTSTGSVQGDRLKGQIAFTMQHRMALAVVKMPNLTYSFTNGGIDDYLLPFWLPVRLQ